MRLLVLAAILVLGSLTAAAQTSDERVEAFIETTDLYGGTEAFAVQLRQMVLMQAGQFPAPADESYRDVMTDALAEETLRQRVRSYLTTQTDPEDLEAATEWLQRPDVAPLIELIIAAGDDPRAQVAVQMYATTGQLGRHEVTPEREAQLRSFLEASGAVEYGVQALIDLVMMSARFNAELLGTEMVDEQVLRAQTGQFADQMMAPMMGTALYGLREVPDEDLDALLAAAHEPGARAYNRITAGAQSHAVVGAMDGAAREFLNRLNELDASGEVDLAAWRAETLQQMGQYAPPDANPQDALDHDHEH